jgi:glycosyltransferase involved in cell wall biosynthesis
MSPGDTVRSVHVDTERTWGGGQRQVAWLAAGLARRGHPTWVVARRGSRYAEALRGSGVEVVPLDPLVEWDVGAAARIGLLARRAGADLVVGHAAHAALLAAMATVRSGIALVVTRRVALPLHRSPLSRWKHHRARRIIAVSQRVRDVLLASGIGPDRVCIVYSGVDLTRPACPAEPGTLRALGLDPGSPVAVMVAALVPPHKDPATFVRALAAARRGRPDLQGLIVGGGPLLSIASRMCRELGLEDAVRLAGHREDAERLLAAAAVAVLSSRDEGLGTTLMDAMLWGIPVVATAAGGVPEVVRDGVDGLLSPPGDADALGRHLVVALNDTDLRARLVASARERVADFSAERMVDRTIEAYRDALYSAGC